MTFPTAVVADDHPLIRNALAMILENAGVLLIGEAEDGLQTIAKARAMQPDLVILDIAMPLANGINVFAEVRRWSPKTRIIIFSGMTSAGLFQELITAGADAIFFKRGDMEAFAAAIPAVLAGHRVIAPEVSELLAQNPDPDSLTLRERQILNLICQGLTNRQIAEQLGVSPKTIDNHRTSLMRKVGVSSVAALFAFAARRGLLEPFRET